MKSAIISVVTHFINKKGRIYAESLFDSTFWQKYLGIFDKIYVLARIKEYEDEVLDNYILSDCENVTFLPLPDHRGPREYMMNYIKIGKLMKLYCKNHVSDTVAIIKAPDHIGYQFLKYWIRAGKPYGMELVSNLSDTYYYSVGVGKAMLYNRLHNLTRFYADKANGVMYVTESVLQNIYPTKGLSISCSDIVLSEEYYYEREVSKKKIYTLIHVSTMEMDSKGHEQFLLTHKALLEQGYSVNSVIVGGGRYKEKYQLRAKELGIESMVRFTGHICKKESIRKELIDADIFLFPTLTEGLPRVLIEAMACSLPCVTSNIPTIKELISDEWLCNPYDINLMTEKIKRLMIDIELYSQVSTQNYLRSRGFEDQNLKNRRNEFYNYMAECVNSR